MMVTFLFIIYLQKTGQRKKCVACKIVAHQGCIAILEKVCNNCLLVATLVAVLTGNTISPIHETHIFTHKLCVHFECHR
jgi:hypothetical protein